MTLAAAKEIIDTVHGGAATVAIVVGAFWAIKRFGVERPLMRRADLTQQIQIIDVSPAHRILHVALQVKNVGTVVLRPAGGDCLVQWVAPLDAGLARRCSEYLAAPADDRAQFRGGDTQLYYDDGAEIRWPALDRRHFASQAESGEVDAGETERWDLDFIVPRNVEVVGVFTELSLDEKKQLWWTAYSLLDVRTGRVAETVATV